MEPSIKYKKILDNINNLQRPIVFVNGLTHGDEKMGKFVIDELDQLKIKSGTLITNIANEKAFEKGVRYIDFDLNRIAPGDKDGSYEEKVAYYLSVIAEKVDVFIDIHSTESTLKNSIIVHNLSNEVREIVNVINPETVLIMKVTGDKVLLSKAKVGIAFEYGNDNDQESINKVTEDIKKILSHLGMIEEVFVKDVNETKIFSVEKFFPKNEGDICLRMLAI